MPLKIGGNFEERVVLRLRDEEEYENCSCHTVDDEKDEAKRAESLLSEKKKKAKQQKLT